MKLEAEQVLCRFQLSNLARHGAQPLYEWIVESARHEDLQAARHAALQLLEYSPADAWTYRELANIDTQLGRLDDAEKALRAATTHRHDYREVYVADLDAITGQGDNHPALEQIAGAGLVEQPKDRRPGSASF